MRAIQGHSGATKVDLSLPDDVPIPYKLSEYLYHLGCSRCMHSTFHSGLLAGKKIQKGRQTVFFTVLDLLSNVQKEEYQDVSKPRKAHYKNKLKVFQDAICRIHLRRAQDKGLQFWQTRSRGKILYDPVPAECIERVAKKKKKEQTKDTRSAFRVPRPNGRSFGWLRDRPGSSSGPAVAQQYLMFLASVGPQQ